MKILMIALALLATGCTPAGTNSFTGNKELTIYMVEGKPMTCFTEHYKMSCDWESYNAN